MPEKELIIAIPKGRILQDLSGFFQKINWRAEDEFYNENTRQLVFRSNITNLKIIKVRSFDVANFVKFGAADLGICGLDVLEEFSSPDIHPLLDLGIGKCRLSLAAKNEDAARLQKGPQQSLAQFFVNQSHIRVATKYLSITTDYFSKFGIQAECIKLNGAMELAPHLGLCDYIVDLVSTGRTLQENNLSEIGKILDVSSYLVVNRNSLRIKNNAIRPVIERFGAAI